MAQGPSSYGEAFADVYDDWYGHVSDVAATVDRVADLAARTGGGPVLELGVGTGRLALPLASRGLDTWGLDASPAMVSRLRAKDGDATVRVVLGDMARPPLSTRARFTVVFCAYNTFFNLDTPAAQEACLRWCAAALADGGHLALEAFVPTDADDGPESPVAVRSIEPDRVVLSVATRDVDDQVVTGQFVELTEAGGVRLRPYRIRYLFPDQLDALAEAAGLELVERTATWDGAPFTDDSPSHVSLYRRTGSTAS